MTSHREEAIRAIDQVAAMLQAPLDGFQRAMAQAALAHAADEVRAIQEVKRTRKTKAEATR